MLEQAYSGSSDTGLPSLQSKSTLNKVFTAYMACLFDLLNLLSSPQMLWEHHHCIVRNLSSEATQIHSLIHFLIDSNWSSKLRILFVCTISMMHFPHTKSRHYPTCLNWRQWGQSQVGVSFTIPAATSRRQWRPNHCITQIFAFLFMILQSNILTHGLQNVPGNREMQCNPVSVLQKTMLVRHIKGEMWHTIWYMLFNLKIHQSCPSLLHVCTACQGKASCKTHVSSCAEVLTLCRSSETKPEAAANYGSYGIF